MSTPIYDAAAKAHARRARVRAIRRSKAAHHVKMAASVVVVVAFLYVVVVLLWAIA